MKTYNFIIAETFVQTLLLEGIKHVFISPGSRSTPLTLAFARNAGNFSIKIVYDERSAAFQALGCALATGTPAVLVCTSGSAVANYFPAIVEAAQSEIPMLVLTADRPFELHESGANQTMPQHEIFGKFVKKSTNMPIADSPDWMEEGKLQKAIRIRAAMGIAHSLQHPRGVVHFNFPFRKPLEPSKEEIEKNVSGGGIQVYLGQISPSSAQINAFYKLISQAERPLMVLGPNAWKSLDVLTADRFAEGFGVPILADILSGRKISAHEMFLRSKKVREMLEPDLIIRVGKVPIGNQLNRFLEQTNAVTVQISESLKLHDDVHKTDYLINASPNILLEETLKRKGKNANRNWKEIVEGIDDSTKKQLRTLMTNEKFEGALVGKLLNSLDDNKAVFLGNSLVIRHAMTYAVDCRAMMFGNRGVSGIDGNLSTALGLGKGLKKEVIAIMGDLTFIHDLNSLTSQGEEKITVVVINNHGGGIFRRLPIANEKEFHQFFLTAHDFTFEKVADFYGLDYYKVESDIPKTEMLKPNSFIEIITDSQEDKNRGMDLAEKIAKKLEDEI